MRIIQFASAAVLALATCACSTSVSSQSGVQNQYDRICVTDETTIAHTIYGDIQGYKDGSVFTFKGVRYAKADRFMPPQAPDRHEGVMKCRVYGPKAPQAQTFDWKGTPQRDYDFGNQFVREPMDEKECLVLNVWTKGLDDGKKRPVFVWIHGGGYASGSGHDLPCYEGRALAEKGDIVTVNLNHRLNLLGFVDLTAVGGPFSQSVNLGLQDIVKALEWIRDNICYFGGDPGNVTIAGQSGGARKVSTLLSMPSAHGLFHKAIIQSGSALTQTLPEASQCCGLAFAEAVGADAAHPEKFNDYSYEELVAIYNRIIGELPDDVPGQKMQTCTPVVDGTIIPQHPYTPEAPAISRDVPVIIGSNFHEFSFDNTPLNEWEAVAQIKARYGERAEEYIAAFHSAYPEKSPRDMVSMDLYYRPNAIRQACRKSVQGGAPVYAYHFHWAPETNILGASHGMELPFMFNNVMLQPEMTGNTPEAHRLEDIISSAWLSFMKTGKPSAPGLPEWTPFTEENQATMILDNQCRVKVNDENVHTLMTFSTTEL